MTQEFTSEEVAQQVRDRLWRYLSQNSVRADIAGVAESLFSLPRGELRRLTAGHLALSGEMQSALEAARVVLRELPSSVTRAEVELSGAVRPPVHWPKTYQRRAASGDKWRFVCRPPERAYDTALARLVALALSRCASLGELARLGPTGPVGAAVASRVAAAEHLLAHVKLRDVALVSRLPERTLSSLGRHRSAQPLIDWVRRASEALDDRSPAVIREIIEQRLLLPLRADQLFELYVGFRLVDALIQEDFTEHDVRLLPSRRVPFASLQRGPESVSLYWQRSLWSFDPTGSEAGLFEATLGAAQMRPSRLRPDFVLRLTNPRRMLFVEAKLTQVDGKTRDRDGIRDALAYAHDAATILAPCPQPHGLVVAWNAEGQPGTGEIMVSDQNQIGRALSLALSQWGV